MKRALLLLALLALPARATCLVEHHGWETWVCDTDAEKAAITGSQEGDHVWAKDTNALYYWDGAAWAAIGGGGGGAPSTATYITQVPDAGLSAEQAMSLLGTGLELNATGTGVQSIYAGSACGGTDKATSISASGVVTCSAVAYANVTGTPAVPTGTGFSHVTAGALDAASKLVNLTAATDVAANQGTTTTTFHGNAAGQGSFASVVSADLNLTTTTCTNQFLTALSAGAAGTCTTDTLASAQHANQGTTVTTLHGNAAGNPSFAAVTLTTDVTGTLPMGNGGTGVAVAVDDTVLIGSGAAWVAQTLPNTFGTNNALGYRTGTNLFQSVPTYQTVSDETTPQTQRAIVNFTGAGVTCADNAVTVSTDCTIPTASNSISVDVDFGSTGNTNAKTVVTGQAWVTAASRIICDPTMFATTSRAEGAEDPIIEGINAAVHTRVAGTGFTVAAAAASGMAYGVFNFTCVGA